MKKLLFLFVLGSVMIYSSCLTPNADESFNDALSLKAAQKVMNFTAHLSGDQEVPAVETEATGQAVFQLSKDGYSLSYKLIVANIDSVRMAHIHLAPAGVNGGVVAWLYPSGPPAVLIEGPVNGILAEGVITETSLLGALEGEPLSALVDALSSGNAYVNVHTATYGGGEIRGQIK
jgi:hypothetical protein